MEGVIAFLEREAKTWNNARAAILLSDWRTYKRLTDAQMYEIARMKLNAAKREAERVAKTRAKIAAREAVRSATAKALRQAERLAKAKAAREALRAKLGNPHE